MNSLVSIVIPIFNKKKYLVECLSSVINQTYSNLDIILVDDGSYDGSENICDEYSKKDKRIKVIHKQNQGLGPARNDGIKEAKGEFLMFLDADDFLENNSVEIALKNIVGTKADVVFFELNYYNQKNKQKIKLVENELYINDPNFKTNKLNNCMTPAVGSAIYDLKWYKKNIPNFPNCIYEDSAIYPFIILKSNKYKIIKDALYNYRINTGNSLSQNIANNFTRINSLIFLMENIQKDGSIDKNSVFIFCINRMNKALNIIKEKFGEALFNTEKNNYIVFFKKYFNKEITQYL